jgi:alcohol dehydrogenase YqhD (iron-dependent ADH family)
MDPWLWDNPTRVAAGVNCIETQLGRFVSPGSRVVCLYDDRSVANNTSKSDLESALSVLECQVFWEEGVRAGPEFDDLVKALPRVRAFEPDLIVAIGGGSTIDSAKFLSWGIRLKPRDDPAKWIGQGRYPASPVPVGAVVTLPASGSWWNPIFALYRRSTKESLSGEYVYPSFSLFDPRYSMSLPVRQLRNSVCDAIIHCVDQFVTGDESPLFDAYWMATMKELFEIGPQIVSGPPKIELHERLFTAASFALNYLFVVGKDPCWAIHFIGCPLTAAFGVDHAVAVGLIAPVLLETKFRSRKVTMAKAAQFVFGVMEGTVDDKARSFIDKLRQFLEDIGQPRRLSEVEGIDLSLLDVKAMTKMVMQHMGNHSFGWNGEISKSSVEKILRAVLV